MKKLIIILLFLIPSISQAKSLKDLTIKFGTFSDVQTYCRGASTYVKSDQFIGACHLEWSNPSRYEIILPNGYYETKGYFRDLLYHELGHFIGNDAQLSEIHKAFNLPSNMTWRESVEVMAPEFVKMVNGDRIDNKELMFFLKRIQELK